MPSRRASALSTFLLVLAGCTKSVDTSRAPVPTVPKVVKGEDPNAKEAEAFKELNEQIRPVVSECLKLGPPKERVTLQGKLLILDYETAQPRKAHGYLDENLQGKPSAKELTIFAIVKKHMIPVTIYSPKEKEEEEEEEASEKAPVVPGYRVDLDVAILRWPSKTPIGVVTLKGDDPPNTVSVSQLLQGSTTYPEFVTGMVDAPLQEWVVSRPQEGQPDPAGDAIKLAPAPDSDVTLIAATTTGTTDPFVYADGMPLKIEGKIFFWDKDADRPLTLANDHLEEEVRGKITDSPLTIVMVTSKSYILTKPQWGNATYAGYVVAWPEKKVLARFKVSSVNLNDIPSRGFFQADGQVATRRILDLEDTAALMLARWIQNSNGTAKGNQ
jgi:hypothetical protein